MSRNPSTESWSTLMRVLAIVTGLGAIGIASAQEVPRGFVASPDIYKVVADSDKYVVIEATWKPGQRDKFHSGGGGGAYFLTECRLMRYTPDGLTWMLHDSAGAAFVVKPVASVSLENVGHSVCKLVLFQPK
jgi:hypothetical protein